ncbi:Tfp pilus assembly protein FimT/FimU, partial [Planctomycetota bacterium]
MMFRIIMNTSNKSNRAERFNGFTFIELLVVLTIIALMMAVVIPYAGRSNESQTIRQESLNIAEALRYITDLAIDTRRPARIVINLQDNSFILEKANEINNRNFQMIEDFGSDSIHYLSKNVQIIDIKGFTFEGNQQYLIFDPEMPWPSGSISLCSQNSFAKINIKGK